MRRIKIFNLFIIIVVLHDEKIWEQEKRLEKGTTKKKSKFSLELDCNKLEGK